MTETAVEDQICDACGVEVRPEALFCYNCGGAVQEEASEENSSEIASDVWLRGNLDEKPDSEEPEPDESVAVETHDVGATEKKSADEPGGIESESKNESDSEADKRVVTVKPKAKPKISSKMKTAASLRKRPRPVKRNRVKVVWEEREGAVNIWFVVGSILITLLVAALFFLAVYLK